MIRSFTQITFLITLLFSQAFSQNTSSEIGPEAFAKTDQYLTQMMDSLEIVGMNYAVLINGEVAHKKSFGLANLEHQVPMDLDKLFAVASISKMFSSIALHELLHKHKRSTDETVADFLPNRKDLPKSWQKLTLKQLLSHTSGIPDQIDYQIYLAPESESYVIENMKDKPFSSKPGEASKYNATGFLLVRIIIEKLADQDFESYMKQQFFERFQLNTAVYGGFKKVVPNRVKSYMPINGVLQMFPLNYSSPMYAGAGLNIDINDLIVWFQALLNEKVLTKEQLHEIWTPVKLNDGKDGYFGLGWEAYRLEDSFRMTGHGGAGISSFRHYWDEKTQESITVILLTNGARNWEVRPNQLNAGVADMLLTDE